MSCYKPFLESVCLCLYGLIYLVKRLVKTIELRYVDAFNWVSFFSNGLLNQLNRSIG